MAVIKFDPQRFDDDPAAAIRLIKNVSNATRNASSLTPSGELYFHLVKLAEAKKRFIEDTKSLPEKDRAKAIFDMMNKWHVDNPPPKIVAKATSVAEKFDMDSLLTNPKDIQEKIDFLGMSPKYWDENSLKKGIEVIKASVIAKAQKKNEKASNE